MNATAAPTTRFGVERFFLLLLGGIVVLLILAGISLLVAGQTPPALPAGSPGRTVQQFYEALGAQDYQRAYALLSDQMAAKPTQDEFVRYNADRSSTEQTAQRVRLEAEKINGDVATVTVNVTVHYVSGAPFGGSEYTMTETFSLRHDAAGWRISDLPYRYRPYPGKFVLPTPAQGG